MRKIKYISVLCILITLFMGCSSLKNEVQKKNNIATDNKDFKTDTSANMKRFKNIEAGYKIAYPKNYEVQQSGGHSPVANPEYEMRLSLYSKDGLPGLDIDSINKVNYKDKYRNIEGFIKYKRLNLKIDENFIINSESNKIYRLEEENYFFVFFENDKNIFQLSSSSKDILKKIMISFKFN